MTDLASLRRQVHEWRVEARFRGARARARPALPPLPPRLRPLLEQIERDGAAISSVAELGAPACLLPELDALLAGTADDGKHGKGYVQHAPEIAVEAAEHVLAWGLGEDLLALCANYIGLPVAYRGVAVRRDLADGEETGTRIWHRDGEDSRILKAIVYVNDVGADGGPFEYVPRPHAPATWRVRVHDGNRADDFEKLVPAAHWRACTGPRGTVVLVDTCAVYHRGRVPTVADRLTAFYCYNSAQPVRPEYCAPLFDRERFRSAHALSSRQASALSYRY